MKTNEIERFEKLQRELGTSPASLITMMEKVESYFLSGSKEFRQTRDTFEGSPEKVATCCGLENRHEENAPAHLTAVPVQADSTKYPEMGSGQRTRSDEARESTHQTKGNCERPAERADTQFVSRGGSQNSLDDVTRNHAEESYCDWMREVVARANEQAAIDDWHDGGKEELERLEAQ